MKTEKLWRLIRSHRGLGMDGMLDEVEVELSALETALSESLAREARLRDALDPDCGKRNTEGYRCLEVTQ